MGKSLTRKIIEAHYVSGSMKAGEEVFIKVDQTRHIWHLKPLAWTGSAQNAA